MFQRIFKAVYLEELIELSYNFTFLFDLILLNYLIGIMALTSGIRHLTGIL